MLTIFNLKEMIATKAAQKIPAMKYIRVNLANKTIKAAQKANKNKNKLERLIIICCFNILKIIHLLNLKKTQKQ